LTDPTRSPVPFHRPSITDAERAAVMAVLDSGWLTTGERVLEFESAVASETASRHAIAVNSATAALHLALEALGVGPTSEVIVPTYTFASCGEVVRYLGARVRLVDVDAATLNVTPELIDAAIGPATRAVIVVHFGGLMADVATIADVAGRRGVAVVEDAAHAFPAQRDGRAAGTVGDAGALSFYATKTITTGEGGMLLTDSDAIADRARVMRLHGISRDAWKRYTTSGSWFYEIEDAGFKYNLTDVAAAIGLAQLERAESMRAARQRVAEAYVERLTGSRLLDRVDLPAAAAAGDVHAWHLFPIRLRDADANQRARVIEALRADGIGTSVHFIPLHLHPYYRRTYGHEPSDLPVAVREFEREISLPIYPDLTEGELDRVVAALERALAAEPVGSGA
jgi:dTDP-4-amino-4,6-dideoxygalactose transaminase